MKFNIKIFIIALIICIPTVFAEASAAIPITLTVDCNNVIKEYDERILGTGIEGVGLNKIAMDNSMSTKVSKDYVNAVVQSGFPMTFMRFGGNASNSYKFKSTIGPFSERPDGINFGMAEFVKTTKAINPKAQLMIGVNIKTDTAEDNADLARFLTLDPDMEAATGSDGTNYAEKRVESGIEAPVTNVIFELGNELDWGGGSINSATAMQVDEYITLCKERMNAIKAVYPRAEFAVQGATSESDSKNPSIKEWNEKVLSELGTQDGVKYLSVHFYYGGWSMSHIMSQIDGVISKVNNAECKDKIRLIISEHAEWPNTENASTDEEKLSNWKGTSSLHGMLWTADFYNQIQQRKEIAGANYYSYNGGTLDTNGNPRSMWRIVSQSESGDYVLSGIGELYKYLYSPEADEVIAAKLSENIYNAYLSASATKTDEGDVRVIITSKNIKNNKDERDAKAFNLNIDVQNAENELELIKKTVISGDSLSADNYADGTSGLQITVDDKKQNGDSVEVPECSVVILEFENADKRIISDNNPTILNLTDAQLGKEVNDPFGKVHFSTAFEKLSEPTIMGYMVCSAEDNNVVMVGEQIIPRGAVTADVVFTMPEETKSGAYILKTGMQTDENLYSGEEVFSFNTAARKNVPLSTIEIANPDVYNDIFVITKRETAAVGTLNDITSDRTFIYAIFEGVITNLASDNIPLYIGQASSIGSTVQMPFVLPENSSSGIYTLVVGYQRHGGEKIDYQTCNFIYQKAEQKYPILITSRPILSTGEIYNISNTAADSTLQFKAKSLSEEDVKGKLLMAMYSEDDVLTDVFMSDMTTFETGEQTAHIDIKKTSVNAEYAKIFIWNNMDDMKPICEGYRIDREVK